jgi:hypothetical protein
MTRQAQYDQLLADIAYRTAFGIVSNVLLAAQLEGREIDPDALLAELANVLKVDPSAAWDAVADAMAEAGQHGEEGSAEGLG